MSYPCPECLSGTMHGPEECECEDESEVATVAEKLMKIYVASSWRNEYQPGVVSLLKNRGYEVYDFRHPEPGNAGFAWAQIDHGWQRWTPEQYRNHLYGHDAATKGFTLDMNALRSADCCVLVLPAGASAHLEAGYAAGRAGSSLVIYAPELKEPELMYRMSDYITFTISELLVALDHVQASVWQYHDYIINAGGGL